MKVPLSWLKEFLDLNLSPEKIAETLTLAGIEVEGIAYDDSDPVFEVSLTPNLGHCSSVLGIARELSALLELPIKNPPISLSENTSSSIHGKISVTIEAKEACFRYSARLVEQVTVGSSPPWVKKRLQAMGLRSVNNVVDAANLVMLETGQPLHTFDSETLEGKQLSVSQRSSTSSLLAIDHKNYEIPEGALLICDKAKPVAFAGVIGSLDSSVTEKTRHVLIESAAFHSAAVRKTAKMLHLKTDASQRFERGVDRKNLLNALNKAAALIQQLAGGEIASGIIDQQVDPFYPLQLACRISRVNRLLGSSLSHREVIGLLERLEIKLLKQQDDLLHVEIPSYRNDLASEVDLIEEVGRLYGFNNLPKHSPRHLSSSMTHAPLFLFENKVRSCLMSEGLQECITCDLISPSQAELTAERELSKNNLIHVLHPCSIDQSVLRASLLPGLLQVVKNNCAQQNSTVSAFEIGRVHFKDGEHYREFSSIGIILTGKNAPYFFNPKPREVDFFDIKGCVENLVSALKVADISFAPSHLLNFHPKRQVWIKREEILIGAMGEVHPAHLSVLKIEQRVFFAALNLHELLKWAEHLPQAAPLSPYPGSQRDWTLTTQEEISFSHILEAVHKTPSSILESVSLLDIYKNAELGEKQKNITLRFFYRDKKKTIETDAVDKEHAKITQEVAKKLHL